MAFYPYSIGIDDGPPPRRRSLESELRRRPDLVVGVWDLLVDPGISDPQYIARW